jgi:short-subunit dehydrogenase
MDLDGRCALVTGATGGLGHAIARALHAAGARLVLTGRREDALGGLAAELGARAVAADLAAPEGVEAVLAAAADADVLVANAGLSSAGALGTFAPEEVRRAVAVNLTAPILLTRGLSGEMARRGSGHIVFLASLSGMTGQPGSALYSATKFGLRGLAQSLRAELRPAGIGVTCVLPGFVRGAGMFHESGTRLPWYLGTSTPEAVAGAVVTSIADDRAEVLVGPPHVRAMARFAAAAPVTAARLARAIGGERITAGIVGSLAAGSRRD